MNAMLSDHDLEVIQDILIEQLDVTRPQLTPEARIEEDLGADSLTMVQIGMALEDRFSLSIPDDQLEKMKTVADAYELLANRLPRIGKA